MTNTHQWRERASYFRTPSERRALLTCSSAILEVFWSLMTVLLKAFCISSICFRYLQFRAGKVTPGYQVHGSRGGGGSPLT